MKNVIVIAILMLSFHLLHAQEPTQKKHVTFEQGDLVISNTARLSDGELDKANEAYSPLIIGVYNEKTATRLMPAILVDGIAYIKFDPSNGPVSTGDYVTSSIKPGYSMKATKDGYVVGVVLEKSNDSGLLKIRVQPMWVKQ